MRRRMISVVAVAICVVVAGLIGAAAVSAAQVDAKQTPARSKPARITWTPRVVTSTQSLGAGESFTTTASFTSTKTVSDIRASVARMPGARITISPTTFSTITAGEVYSLTITVFAPSRLRRGTHTATVYLREGRRLLSNALPVRWRPGP